MRRPHIIIASMSTSRHAQARKCQGIHCVKPRTKQHFILWIVFYVVRLLDLILSRCVSSFPLHHNRHHKPQAQRIRECNLDLTFIMLPIIVYKTKNIFAFGTPLFSDFFSWSITTVNGRVRKRALHERCTMQNQDELCDFFSSVLLNHFIRIIASIWEQTHTKTGYN